MVERRKIHELNDFFTAENERREKGVYFYRITSYHPSLRAFILRYYEEARLSGVVIEGGIKNPDEKNLSYYAEVMGMEFRMNREFLSARMKTWLPRMNETQHRLVVGALYDTLTELSQAGKNEHMLKNAYIKFMCWLYYRFERIISRLGDDRLPKILYEGELNRYELLLLSILSRAGCDIVLLLPKGEEGYRKADPGMQMTDRLELAESGPFPPEFCLKELQKEIIRRQKREHLYGTRAKLVHCTNSWADGHGLSDLLIREQERGNQPDTFYTCFYQIDGVEDKLTYMKELYELGHQIAGSGRKLLILEREIPAPTMEEINQIRRGPSATAEEIGKSLAENIRYSANIELQRWMVQAFLDLLFELAELPEMNGNRLMNKGVQILCWLKRYQGELFSGWKLPETGCLIYLGGCQNENEALFMRFIARLPVDVLVLNPEKGNTVPIADEQLCRMTFSQTLKVKKYPRETTDIRLGTAAFHAEQELDSILYDESGIYRDRQYQKSVAITLQTMYEEIAILWDQELKYRPNFGVVDDVVNLPVIFAKVSGVKDGAVSKYWTGIKALITEDTYVIKHAPWIVPGAENPMREHAPQWLKNKKLQKNQIKEHKDYPYGFLREELQDYLLDKLQLLLDRKCIRGTYENGTEYTIVATVMNLNKELLRLAQRFDLTRKNPKLIYINAAEKVISLEDSIIAAYLNLVGFDVLFFVPTGYQTVEKHFQNGFLEEHQAGEYLYDLRVPNLKGVSVKQNRSWRDRLMNFCGKEQ